MEPSYEDITAVYRETDKELADFSYALSAKQKNGRSRFLIPDREEFLKMNDLRLDLIRKVEALEDSDPVCAVWKGHFRDFAGAFETRMEEYFCHPEGIISRLMYGLEDLFRNDAREASVRFADYAGLAKQFPEVMEAFFKNGMVLPGSWKRFSNQVGFWQEIREEDLELAKKDALLAKLPKEELADFSETMDRLWGQLSAWKKTAEAAAGEKNSENMADSEGNSEKEAEVFLSKENDSEAFKKRREHYRRILRERLGVELDELLSWYEEEMEKTRAEVFAIAGKLPIPENNPQTMQEVNEILLKYAGPCDTPEEMYARGQEYLKRTKKAAQETVWLPEKEVCALTEIPVSLRKSYPWGGYEGGDGRKRPITGSFFLNRSNFRAVTDGWIKMNAVHEAYPGHHVQYVRSVTNYLPETAKIGVKEIPLIEGTSHRSERVFEWIYPEDPFYPLFVAYRRHHTSVRIRADLMLRYFERPVEEVTELYRKELGFDEKTARGQVQAQEDMEGYFTCYYYGMKKLCDWEKKYGYDPKTYTELLFDAGYVSLETFEAFLKLDEEQKKRYRKDFCSRYRSDEKF